MCVHHTTESKRQQHTAGISRQLIEDQPVLWVRGGKDEGGKEAESKEKKFLNFFSVFEWSTNWNWNVISFCCWQKYSLHSLCPQNAWRMFMCFFVCRLCVSLHRHMRLAHSWVPSFTLVQKIERRRRRTDFLWMGKRRRRCDDVVRIDTTYISLPSLVVSLCTRRKHLCYFFFGIEIDRIFFLFYALSLASPWVDQASTLYMLYFYSSHTSI